jgi:hypothetical protein
MNYSLANRLENLIINKVLTLKNTLATFCPPTLALPSLRERV